jgi:hypothetical protein
MQKYDKIYDTTELSVLEYDYIYYPPEFKVYSNYAKMVNNYSATKIKMSIANIKLRLLEDYFESYQEIEHILDDILNFSRYKIKEQLESYIDHILIELYDDEDENRSIGFTKSKLNIMRKLLEKHANKIDVFSMGIVLLRIYSKIVKNNEHEDIMSIIKSCLQFNPHKRIGMNELYEKMKEIL